MVTENKMILEKMKQEIKKPDPKSNEEWAWLTNRQKMDPLFIGTYNRKAYSEVENFISDAYSNPSANCLLTICAEENGCGLTSMLRTLQNDQFDKGNNKYIYLTAETFVELAIQTLRTGKATSLTLVDEGESIFRDVSGIMIDNIQYIIDKSSSLKQLCDVIEKFTTFKKPVILSTNLLSKEQLLELAKEDDRFFKLIVTSVFVRIEKPSREDRLLWTVLCMEKDKVESDDKLAKYYIARESLRDIRIVCGALRFYGREQFDSEEYVKFSINDIHKVKYKIRIGQYMKDTLKSL